MQKWSGGLEEGDGNTCLQSELLECCILVRLSDRHSPRSGSTVQVKSSGYGTFSYLTVESIFMGAQWILWVPCNDEFTFYMNG